MAMKTIAKLIPGLRGKQPDPQSDEHAEQPKGGAGNDLFTVIELNGQEVRVNIARIPALDGYELRTQAAQVSVDAIRGARSEEERAARRDLALHVLSYASIQYDEQTIVPLDSERAINDQLQHWANIEFLVTEVLRQNGIPYDAPIRVEEYWGAVGKDIAAHFMAAASLLAVRGLAGTDTHGAQKILDEVMAKSAEQEVSSDGR